MPRVSADIDTFLKTADNAAARTALGAMANTNAAVNLAVAENPAATNAVLKRAVTPKSTDYAIASTDHNAIHEVTVSGTVDIDLDNAITVGTLVDIVVKGAGQVTLTATGTATIDGAARLYGSGSVHTLYKASATVWQVLSSLSVFSDDALNYGRSAGITDPFQLGQVDNLLRWANQESCANSHNGAEWETLGSSPDLREAWFLSNGKNAATGNTVYGVKLTNNGTRNGGVEWGGRGMTFPDSAAGDDISTADSGNLDPTTGISLVTWCYLDTTIGNSHIIGKYGNSQRQYYMRNGTGGVLQGYVSEDAGGTAQLLYAKSGAISSGAWFFPCMTFTEGDPKGTLKLFKDSVEQTSLTLSLDNDVGTIHAGTNPLHIGGLNSTDATPWDGVMAFAAVFGRALTAAEQYDLMAITKPRI